MKQFTFNLDKKLQRPIIVLNDIRILVDTGAKFPIWTAGERAFVHFGGTIDTSKKPASFTGFGGRATGRLGRFNFTMGGIIYPNMPVILNSDTDISADIILGAPNFEGMIYQIDTINHKLNIDIPDDNTIRNLAIQSDNGKITVYLLNSVTRNDEISMYTEQDLNANYIHKRIEQSED